MQSFYKTGPYHVAYCLRHGRMASAKEREVAWHRSVGSQGDQKGSMRYFLEAIRKQHLAKQYICSIVSAYPLSRGVRSYVEERPVAKEVSLGSHGRTMGHRGTTDPACQAAPTRRAPAYGRHAGSPQHDFLSEPERLSMGHVAA